jgi:hypothetical protein
LRALPAVTGWGTLLLVLAGVLLRIVGAGGTADSVTNSAMDSRWLMTDIYVFAAVILHWTVVFTAAIAAAIVWLMKGPAYVADAYDPNEDDSQDQFPRNQRD